MTDDLQKKIDALKAIAPKLDTATQKATEAIAAVDAALQPLNLWIDARYAFDFKTWEDEATGAKMQTVLALAWGRFEGRHCVHVLRDTEREANPTPSDPDAWPWESVNEELLAWSTLPKSMKLRSVGELGEFLDAILEEANGLVGGADQASEDADNFLQDPEDDEDEDS